MAFGIYLHVPFCTVRCGYCDFNTYTAAELLRDGTSTSRETYLDSAMLELASVPERVVDTVFVGGGTPTLVPTGGLTAFLSRLDLADGAEVTIEANPDSVTPASLAALREGGFTRISFGVQSVVPHVLAVLDRTHDPERVPEVVRSARSAGFEQVSLDLIYGTPSESMDDWRRSVETVLSLEPDHISAYALIVEDGTAFARQVRRGEVVMPDDDETADKYLLADELFSSAGLHWYELSNWARNEAAQCRHNLLYWHSEDWWGVGPGAHSHIAGRRWWNVKHPAAYADRLGRGQSPRADGEHIDDATRQLEEVMLRTRLRAGVPLELIPDPSEVVAAGWARTERDRLVLTRSGRLVADHVIRLLT